MRRTDAHRPSAINPDDYDFVACDYYGGGYEGMSFIYERKAFHDHMDRTGGKFARHHNSGTCHICGARALYVAKYHHVPSNTYIVTGMDCADKMAFGGTGVFKAFRAKVSHERKLYKGKTLAREILALLGMSEAYRIYVENVEGKQEDIISSIVAKLVQYGNISEKQATLIAKLLSDIADRPRRDAQAAAERAAAVAKSDYVGTIGQRIEFDLTVTFCASFETQYGIMYVHNMTDAAGNVVVYKGARIAQRGDKVKMVATVKAHNLYRDIKQTVVSRPKMAA